MEADTTIPPMKTTIRDQDFFSTSIEPMLFEGREAELCAWLKDIGFIQRSNKCKTPSCNGHEMSWKKARIIDKYHWVCPLCKKKASIRLGSFLEDIQCSVRSAIEAILGWCEGVSVDGLQNDGKIKSSIVKRIYSQCSNVVDWYILKHPEISILGGENSVVIIDIFPDGCMTMTPHNNNYTKQVLCVADTLYMPPRIWTHILEPGESKDHSKLIPLLLSHIRPGSTLVVTPQLFPELRNAKDMAEVISIEALMALDHDDYQRSLKNLETIWASTVSVCQEIQDMSGSDGGQLLRELQWRTIFQSRIKSIFMHIVEYQAHMRS
ncbi:uncharacterized protein LOC142322912 [Lycorma delicatula]|uniref:uncharacterized protein LOC142322912 n=1 Tax=Lycorma delicatula TaxID=130591 RepID=UPI003F51561F